jgi:acetyl esterase/lipase
MPHPPVAKTSRDCRRRGSDLVHDENLDYARRLVAAKTACELRVVAGAYHGFDAISRKAQVSQDFRASYIAALRRALFTAVS